MTLTAGLRLGSYEILSLLGAGGMGEVYRARDVKLSRDVALKILPDSFATDPERLARFQREAQVLASLNHPHIGAIYGLEESGGIRALVLELVEGPTLADRIAQGAIPLDEALPMARQIAEALEAAHEQGVIHRDLKPANIKVRPDGTVKVLDFGLAKLAEAPGASGAVGLSQSPTITTPAMMTGIGTILGTAAYMSPEQAKGRPADERSDVWAFGCVLYEMLTGKRLFEGDDVSDTLANVLKREPDWTALPVGTPGGLRRLLRRSLQKDRRRRLADVADARVEIEEVLADPSAAAAEAAAAESVSRRRGGTLLALAFVTGGVTAGVGVWVATRTPPRLMPAPVARFTIPVTPADQLLGSNPLERRGGVTRPSRTAFAISPDGQTLVFSAIQGTRQQLYIRALDRLEATAIPGTEGGESPFFAPDGRWLAFSTRTEIKKVPLSGGPAIPVCQIPSGLFGASWGVDATIVFAAGFPRPALFEVSAAGGRASRLTTLQIGEWAHVLPHMLPGGRAVLFTIQRTTFRWDDAQVVARSLVTGEQKVLIEGGADARYVPTGHLLYARMGTLMAAPFDPVRLAMTGDPVGLIDNVMQAVNTRGIGTDTGAAQFTVSPTGTLVYVTGGIFPDAERSLDWFDRRGVRKALPAPPGAYLAPRLSPDGRQVALFTQGTRQVWIADLASGTLSRLTTEGLNQFPIWTPDGRRVAFGSFAAGVNNVFWRSVDRTSSVERLTTSEHSQTPSSWSPDGMTLALVDNSPATSSDISILSIRDRTIRPLIRTPAREEFPEFSPDGGWLAYTSDESGRTEVFVQPYPGPGERHAISTDGGTAPAWSPAGRELFYLRQPDAASARVQMMSVEVSTTPTFRSGIPRLMFEATSGFATGPVRGYDVARDGQRFLTAQDREQPAGPPPAQMVVVQNWLEELKQRVPTR